MEEGFNKKPRSQVSLFSQLLFTVFSTQAQLKPAN